MGKGVGGGLEGEQNRKKRGKIERCFHRNRGSVGGHVFLPMGFGAYFSKGGGVVREEISSVKTRKDLGNSGGGVSLWGKSWGKMTASCRFHLFKGLGGGRVWGGEIALFLNTCLVHLYSRGLVHTNVQAMLTWDVLPEFSLFIGVKKRGGQGLQKSPCTRVSYLVSDQRGWGTAGTKVGEEWHHKT